MNVKQEIDNRLESFKGDLSNLSQDVRQGGRQVWLAGLGAVGLAAEQRREIFGELVEKGEQRRRRLEGSAREAAEKVGSDLKKIGGRVEAGASRRVERTLERLGVPTGAQIRQLIDQVERLTRKVEQLAQA